MEWYKLNKFVRNNIIPKYEKFKFDTKRDECCKFIMASYEIDNYSKNSRDILDILIDYYKDWNIFVYEFIDQYNNSYIVIKSIDL